MTGFPFVFNIVLHTVSTFKMSLYKHKSDVNDKTRKTRNSLHGDAVHPQDLYLATGMDTSPELGSRGGL